MLLLTRKPGETIDIVVDGRKVEVTVVGVKGMQVRLAIKADRDISVNRREITQKIEIENETKDRE